MKYLLAIIAALTLATGAGARDIDGPRDQFGQVFRLRSWSEDRLVVVAFLGIECPLVGLYSNRLNELHETYANRGVGFVAVVSNGHDTYDEMVAFSPRLNFTVVKDEGNTIADAFDATKSPEVVLLDQNREAIYRGRIDDQYEPGVHSKPEPIRRDLELAIQQALNFETISVPVTEAAGCRIDRAGSRQSTGAITYAKHVSRIFDARCVECHQPGQAAPFSLLGYEDAAAWKDTIRDVIQQRRMPPWGARGGHFLNDRSLNEHERATIFAWLDAGAPEGDPADRPIPPKFSTGWSIRPDRVFSMTAPFVVPSEGVLDYQEFAIDPGFSDDTWVQAIEIRPGNRAVVHHVNVYLKPKTARPGELFVNDLGDYYMAMAVPGNSITALPAGTAKVIPAGWNIVLSIHYVPNGSQQTDTSSIALTLADRTTVRRQIATRAILDDHLVIAPFEKKIVTHQWLLEDDFTLFALYPHMHLRGRSMVFEATYPDGHREILLDVEKFDFAWQYRYVLRTPKPLPRGTFVTCTAVYDNTAENKNNPAPSSVVRAGKQTTDEMFQACFEVCRTNEDMLAGRPSAIDSIAWRAIGIVAAFSFYRRATRHRRNAVTA